MKYYKTSRFPRVIGSAGFTLLISLALIAIGAAIWFAVANNKPEQKTPTTEPPTQSTPSYDEPSSSYNENTPSTPDIINPAPATGVAGNEATVPYESQEEKTEPEPQPEKRSFVLPVDGSIIKDYSDTALQYSATYGDMRLHTGIDIAAATGTDVKAAGTGTITSVEDSATYGKTVIIDHGDGITVKYCGLDSISAKQGDKVTGGDIIGTVGTVPCECSDKSHIHIEVIKDSKHISPLKALGFE